MFWFAADLLNLGSLYLREKIGTLLWVVLDLGKKWASTLYLTKKKALKLWNGFHGWTNKKIETNLFIYKIPKRTIFIPTSKYKKQENQS